MSKFSYCFYTLLILCAFLFTGCAGSRVNFQSYHSSLSLYHSDPLNLTANLNKPEGEGPFPALVLLHGCAGINEAHHWWARKLNAEGYVTLVVNSLRPRHLANVCGGGKLSKRHRAVDAYGAMRYLKSQSFVDPEKIGVIGWSHGGGGVLVLSNEAYSDEFPPNERFDAAIAFYPKCSWALSRYTPNTDLLILFGDADDWLPHSPCESLVDMIQQSDTDFIAEIAVFENATHSYDVQKNNRTYLGHKLEYNKKATDLSWEKIKKFLKKNML